MHSATAPHRGGPEGAARSPGGTLVVRGGALGDILLAFPLLVALRRGDGARPIHLVAPARGGRLAVEVGLADAWTRIDAVDADSAVDALGARSDRVIYLRADLEDRRAALAAGGATVVGGDPRPPAGVHAADHLAGLAGEDAADPALVSRFLVLPDGARRTGREALGARGLPPGGTVVLAAGSGKVGTRWPAHRFEALAEDLRRRGVPVAWLIGPVERDTGEPAPGPGPVLAPDDPLDTAAVLVAAGALVGNDTGTTHLAATFGVPTLALFGATDPRQWAPRGERVRLVDGGAGGMDAVGVDEVARALADLLGSCPEPPFNAPGAARRRVRRGPPPP